MPVARILIDGYSLLHCWDDLAPGKARYSAPARDELIHWLTQYQDAVGTPLTIVFDGAGAPLGTPKVHSTPQVEILFSEAGQTADQVIERATHRLRDYGEVLVVTDDNAERDTIASMGGFACTCHHFIQDVQSTLREMQRDLHHLNQRELRNYRKNG